jgi:VanZ family protein
MAVSAEGPYPEKGLAFFRITTTPGAAGVYARLAVLKVALPLSSCHRYEEQGCCGPVGIDPKILTTLAIIYGGLLFYASLMPFDFAIGPHIDYQLKHILQGWPIHPHARISGSDVLSNLLLYAPLGWLIAARCRFHRMQGLSSLLVAAGICALISATVESLQLFTISRVASVADWVLNTISGTMGALLGASWGPELWIGSTRWLKSSWKSRPSNIATLIFMALLAAEAWSPFLPTLLLKQVWRALQRSHFNPVIGFAVHPWHWWIVTRVMVYAALTMLLAGWRREKPGLKELVIAAVVAADFTVILEFIKPLFVSRAINTANVLASWAGCILAIPLARLLNGRLDINKKLGAAIGGIFLYLVYIWWTPFNFIGDVSRIAKTIHSPVQLLPFYDYAMGATLNQARLFVQSVSLISVWVYLLRLRLGWHNRTRRGIFFAAVFSALLGAGLEFGQIFLPTRTASMTDVYCFALGGCLGAWLRPPKNVSHGHTQTHTDKGRWWDRLRGSVCVRG